MKKSFAILAMVIGASAGGAWLYLFELYSAVSPESPIIAQGKVIKENNHGHVFYIDAGQDDALWYLAATAFVALAAGGILLSRR